MKNAYPGISCLDLVKDQHYVLDFEENMHQ